MSTKWKPYNQCQGRTKKGRRCKAKARSGGYCDIHHNQKPRAKKESGRIDYREYINSAEWAKRSRDILHKGFYYCALCGGKATETHHNSYRNLGNEKDWELINLCNECHSLFHKTHKYDQEKNHFIGIAEIQKSKNGKYAV